MKRVFFDVAANSSVQYDYRGREFDKPEDAHELAELIALDLECIDEGEWTGGEVRVCNVSGERIFSASIRKLDLITA